MAPPAHRWWKDGTVYQIWPASYKDSNGDGLGDIPGIISTLDYVKDLGIDYVWLSPMYDSPQHDMGYDIANYEGIWPKFGTMDDMDTLIREVHARGMKLILDLVVNHTSDEHKWFQESKKSKDNEYSDWYFWRDPKIVDGHRKPPNNWKSLFGGSAWEYVPEREQYYLHLFLPQQPDLNWENPITRKGIYKSAIEFWLDKGIAGFRVDVVGLYSKDVTFPDAEITNPDEEYQLPITSVANGPRMHEFLIEQRNEALEKYGDVVMIGELGMASDEELIRYVSSERRELDMIFDFSMVGLGIDLAYGFRKTFKHTLPAFKLAHEKMQNLMKTPEAWTTVFAENHDQARSICRFATDDPKYREKSGKMLAVLFSTLSGTLFLYQGQEIGMVNMPLEWVPDECKDIIAVNLWKEVTEMHDQSELDDLRKGLQMFGRDNARTPVQWSAEENAGFSTGTPWMRVNDNYREINVAAQLKDPNSLLEFWKKALKNRREHRDALIYGTLQVFDVDNPNTFTYVKDYEGKKILVVLNFTDDEQLLEVPVELEGKKLALLIANVDQIAEKLTAWEGRAYLVE